MNKFLTISLLLIITALTRAQDFDFNGQITANHIYSYNKHSENFSSLRFIPRLASSALYLSENWFIDFDLSGLFFINSDYNGTQHEAKLFRGKIRIANDQYEIRGGLQKINFGPARMLRTLRWFDSVNPADPTGFTEGVYGIKARYSSMNNSIYEIWSLYGNEKRKGIEQTETAGKKPEFGGRILLPLGAGETGAVFHTRTESLNGLDFREYRYGFNFRYEYEVGAWIEAMAADNRKNPYTPAYNNMITTGMDYTFGMGNGLYTLAEHMLSSSGNNAGEFSNTVNITAMLATYPWSLFDSFSLYSWYLWNINEGAVQLQWQQTYDTFYFNIALFHFPGHNILAENSGYTKGNGISLIVNYNF